MATLLKMALFTRVYLKRLNISIAYKHEKGQHVLAMTATLKPHELMLLLPCSHWLSVKRSNESAHCREKFYSHNVSMVRTCGGSLLH